MASVRGQLLCQWCQENTFGMRTLGLLEYTCGGARRRGLANHTLSGEPFYFWTSQPLHSGYNIYFSRPFQSVTSDAEAGCIFCALLVAGVRKAPPKSPEQCYFKGPAEAFDDFGDIINAARERRTEAESAYKESFLRNLDPQWHRHYSYAEVVQRAIEAGLPSESLLLAYKAKTWAFEDVYPNGGVRVPGIYGGVLERSPGAGPWVDSFRVHGSGVQAHTTPTPDFGFTLLINEPWDYGTVCWPYQLSGPDFGVEFSKCYFRLYPTEPREHWEGLASATQKEILDDVTRVWDEAGDRLSTTQSLVRDGVIFQALMKDCVSNHRACTPSTDLDLPRRLLSVSGSLKSPSVRLVEVQQDIKHPPRYSCLSYCWGGLQPGMTTADRIPSYSENIDFTEMPKTVQDAVKVTLSLGIEFLWVDAYCIVQDSGHDKIVELGKMSSIYHGAYCTIAAMSAKSATEGFLEPHGGGEDNAMTWNVDIENAVLQSGLGRGSPCLAILEMRKDFEKPDLRKESLVTRAWTLQEALLSPRLLMFFSAGQRPALRCASRIVRSDGGIIPHVPMELSTLKPIGADEQASTLDASASENGFSHQWKTIVQEYTKRAVTNPTDRLPALIGIVAEIESRAALGTYVVGMWSKTLRCDLLWEVESRDSLFHARQETGRRAAYPTYVGPSWSWVSRNHPVFYSLDNLNEGSEPQISYYIDPTDPELPNGAIRSARLTITCSAKEVDVPNDWEDGDRDFHFDDKPRPLDIGKMWLLHIADYEPYNNAYSVGLGVVEVEDRSENSDEKLYKRIGMYKKGAGEEDAGNTNLHWPLGRFILV